LIYNKVLARFVLHLQHAPLDTAILSRDKVARENRAVKSHKCNIGE